MNKSFSILCLAGLLAVTCGACGDLNEYSGQVCFEIGELGCPCHNNGTCNETSDGVLVCIKGRCELPPCPEGSAGCQCGPGDVCDAGLICNTDGLVPLCQAQCYPGGLGCPCAPGGQCAASGTGRPRACIDGLCVEPDCVAGSRGCYCQEGGLCDPGNVCDGGWCVEDTGQTLAAPEAPKCYTPCRGGEVTNHLGLRAVCSFEGLLEGCIGGAICVDGSCVQPSQGLLAENAVPCQSGADCPPHQNCIEGGCYSDCEQDTDCREPRRCHLNACRVPCVVGDAEEPCESGFRCDTENMMTGYCMPVAPGNSSAAPPPASQCPAGRAPVPAGTLVFTKNQTDRSFTVTNCSADTRTFSLKKLDHTIHNVDGMETVTDAPLDFIDWGPAGDTLNPDETIDLLLQPEDSVIIQLENNSDPDVARWDGTIKMTAPGLPDSVVRLTYADSPAGQWAGKAYLLANFGTGHMDEWLTALAISDQAAGAEISEVGNALVRRWWGFRSGQIPYDEFQAMITSTLTESWRWPVSQNFCDNENAACYPSDNLVGFSVYSDDLEASPVPTGVSEMDLVMNLEEDASPLSWSGRIDSGQALQCPGEPSVFMEFADDPSECFSDQTDSSAVCITVIRSMAAQVVVGGRFASLGGGAPCGGDARFAEVTIPWLVPGFERGTEVDSQSGQRWTNECRDTLLPFGAPDPTDDEDNRLELNLSMAGSNPVPNGRSVRSEITLLDGVLINADKMFILYEQRLPALVAEAATSTTAYGIMMLRRTKTVPAAEDYQGSYPPADPSPPALPENTCAQWLVEELYDPSAVDTIMNALATHTMNAPNIDTLATGVLEGINRTTPPAIIGSADDSAEDEEIHYLCHMNGYIDEGGPNKRVACPPGSMVTFFSIKRNYVGPGPSPSDPPEFSYNDDWTDSLNCNDEGGICLPDEPCAADQRVIECSLETGDVAGSCVETGGCMTGPGASRCDTKGNCKAAVDRWVDSWNRMSESERANHWFRPHPEWRCLDEDAPNCDMNRYDLRENKAFYKQSLDQPVFAPLVQEIDEAFRYKTRFISRLSGASVGFAPMICLGDAIPYCYDPAAIEMIRDRVDCLAHLYAEYNNSMPPTVRARLDRYLSRNFSYEQILEPGRPMPTIYYGFEFMNAELLVMLGDEAYTSAFASRFDLADQMVASFKGSAFEPDGIDLAGGAGYEMYSLYQATQYYQTSLDRFFGMTDTISTTLDPSFNGLPYIGPEASVSWLKKLIRASSQKARAWAEIAKRYHGFNRPGPARRVIEKAYVTAYLESIYISQLMKQVLDVTSGTEKAQVEKEIELAQLTYKQSLLEMKTVRAKLTDQVTHFGFPDTYVPFPALDPGDTNAFEIILDRARGKLDVAAEKEAQALADQREFETDAAAFQSELASIEIDYSSQLGAICGTFRVSGSDGDMVYPATKEYAYLGNDRMKLISDPCGMVGNGSIHEALGELELARLAMEQWKLRYNNLMQTARDEELRIGEQCSRITSFADWRAGVGAAIVTFTTISVAAQSTMNMIDRIHDNFKEALDKASCILGTATDCPFELATGRVYDILFFSHVISTGLLELAVVGAELSLSIIEQSIAVREIQEECNAAIIDGRYVVRDIMRQLAELDLEGLQLVYEANLAVSRLEGLRNEALSIMASKQEQTRLTIDVEAARNDPNIRIYRNDAIINADRTFQSALREAYRATVMYEYYTSTTFAAKGQLYLTRMVSHGDYPLEAYLDELEEAFWEFEESFGNPDLRVEVISLADDVFKISRSDHGQALTPAQLKSEFFNRLHSMPKDERGAFLIDFMTSLERLSPLTHNHRLRFLEVELIGTNLGDELGRVYVRQKGDGVGFIRGPEGDRIAYSLPDRTAVVDVTFNGERPLSDVLGLFEGSTWDIYRSERLRDRPLHHSGWQLILSMQDEYVNQDIDLTGLEDVKIYLWYNDFTEL